MATVTEIWAIIISKTLYGITTKLQNYLPSIIAT
jgi:hypothetical protein